MYLKKIDYKGKEKKIIKVLSEECPGIGYSSLRKILRNSDIKVNGKRIKEDITVSNGDIIHVYYNEKQDLFTPKVLFEDENLIVFYKPKKISSQGIGSFEEKVKNFINKNYILCHRLDTNTDGILIFAKNIRIFEEIKNLFAKHEIEKHYKATVVGNLNESGEFADYIIKDANAGMVYVYSQPIKGAKQARLKYATMNYDGEKTELDITLITGRTHQIRAQLAYHGHPIIGDGKYGKEEYNRKFREKTQALTAYKIIFNVKSGPLQYLDKKIITIF